MGIFDFLNKKKQREPITRKKLQAEGLKQEVLRKRADDIKGLQKVNKQIKLITEHGDVEIVIRNVHGLIKELKK